jgi:hypothetical protein
MPLPADFDHDKLCEVALAFLALTAFRSNHATRAWKGMDWDVLDLLFRHGWISGPKGPAKSVILTDEGERLAETFLRQHFGR